MATLLAPYNTAMQLGQGFNSFTQELCVDRAVIRDADLPAKAERQPVDEPSIAQNVSYKLSIIDKVTDVTNAMKINAAFAIKYDAFDAKGNGDFIDTSKIKESDVSFMIQVKVINQVIYDNTLIKFNPISELKDQNFASIYGDCFISGFQEGGEFVAVISVKAKNRSNVETIKADAAINFTSAKVQAEIKGGFGKEANSLMDENETTVAVTWTGGGQSLKKDTDDWTFENMRMAALKFPTLVAKTPMRTHAILTKFTALRSFYSPTNGAAMGPVPNFEQAGIYASFLQESYLDYKTISKNLQVLTYDVSCGIQRLLPSPAESMEKSVPAVVTSSGAAVVDSDSDTVVIPPTEEKTIPPGRKRITNPFPPTIDGLEEARQTVRRMLNQVIAEVDAIARNPNIAMDESRGLIMSAAQFRNLLPVGETITPSSGSLEPSGEPKKADLASQLAGMADGGGGVARF